VYAVIVYEGTLTSPRSSSSLYVLDDIVDDATDQDFEIRRLSDLFCLNQEDFISDLTSRIYHRANVKIDMTDVMRKVSTLMNRAEPTPPGIALCAIGWHTPDAAQQSTGSHSWALELEYKIGQRAARLHPV
jgi:hypothetical protein